MKVRKLTFGAMCLAMSLLLPQVFHFIGYQQAGAVFLPMHLPVFIGGMLLGPIYGLFLGVFAPLTSFVLTGMPSAERVLFMICELATYGTMSGILFHQLKFNQKRFGSLLALIIAMLSGRLIYAFVISVATYVFHIPFGGLEAVMTAIVTGMPGILIQCFLIPPVVNMIEKGGYFQNVKHVTKEA